MFPTILLLLAGYQIDAHSIIKVSDIAPSLPATSRVEEDRFDEIINRFILADTGKLKGDIARKAVADFDNLKKSAIPALIRGLDRAARINHSCPILIIGKKLSRFLLTSNDPILLDYARDELQSAASGTIHATAVQNLRVQLMLRKNSLDRIPLQPQSLALMPTPGLIALVGAENGERKKSVIAELAKRDGREVLLALARSANSSDPSVKTVSRSSLDKYLSRQSISVIKETMTEPGVESRRSAIRVAIKNRQLVTNIIDCIVDENADVRSEARAALLHIADKVDFGPVPRATKSEQEVAQKKWRAWWDKQNERK